MSSIHHKNRAPWLWLQKRLEPLAADGRLIPAVLNLAVHPGHGHGLGVGLKDCPAGDSVRIVCSFSVLGLFFSFFLFFMAAPGAHGSSWARAWIAAAAGAYATAATTDTMSGP